MSKIVTKVTCPHCGLKFNKSVLAPDSTDKEQLTPLELIYCDCEEGGCGDGFLFRAVVTATAEVEVCKPGELINQEDIEIKPEDRWDYNVEADNV